MIVIPYVDTLLVAWGKWVARQQDGGVGWPSCSPMFKDTPSGVMPSASKPPLGIGGLSSECEETDKAVKRLSEAEIQLLRSVYVDRETAKSIAERLGCCRRTVCNRLETARAHFLGHVNDVAACY